MPKSLTDKSTNAALVILGAIALGEKITGQDLPEGTKMTIMEVTVAVGLWFTGKPSQATLDIARQLRQAPVVEIVDPTPVQQVPAEVSRRDSTIFSPPTMQDNRTSTPTVTSDYIEFSQSGEDTCTFERQ